MKYELIPHDVRKRHVRIQYKGVVIADGIDYGKGWYEEQIGELCEKSF